MAFLLLSAAAAASPGDPPAPAANPAGEPGGAGAEAAAPASTAEAGAIVLHSGQPGVASIGQTLADLLRRLPGAAATPFAGQTDATTVRALAAGISCVTVGDPPEEQRVASAGFNFDGVYEGAAECGCRTQEGIGKGSTVNDLLERYGRPIEIIQERRPGTGGTRRPGAAGPPPPERYVYAAPDGRVRTTFVVEENFVRRVMISDLEPIERHILRRPPDPAAPAPAPSPVPPAPPAGAAATPGPPRAE